MTSPKKILMIGNLPVKDPRSLGGATVLTKRILGFVKENSALDFDFMVIRKHWRSQAQWIDYILFPFRFLSRQRKFDHISFHASTDFHLTVAPFITLFCRLIGKPFTYHFFGGSFHRTFQKLPKFYQKWIAFTLLKADTVFMETLEMMRYFENGSINLKWLPNSRKPPASKPMPRKFEKRFVFISRVTPSKGIDIIAKAANDLPADYVIDIYGPLDTRFYKKEDFDKLRVNYCGAITADEVISTLLTYNVLLLPTFHPGEGYPGIVIEALSVGLPVITTQWNAMEELITDGVNGKVIPVRSNRALVKAMRSFTTENFTRFSKNACDSFAKFNSDLVFKRILESYD